MAPRRWQNLQPLDGVRMSQEPSLGGRASQGTLRLRLHVARIRRIQLPLFALLLTDSGRRTELTRSNLLFFSPLLLLSLSLCRHLTYARKVNFSAIALIKGGGKKFTYRLASGHLSFLPAGVVIRVMDLTQLGAPTPPRSVLPFA